MADERAYEDLEREALFTILSETERLANVGGWEWDIVKDVWTFSDNWLRLHGCSKRHLTTSDLLPIAHPDDRQDVKKAFDMAVTEGASYKIEHRIIRQDTGEVRYVRALGKPKLNDDGKTIKLFGSAQDITDKIEIGKKLRNSEKRYRNLVSNLPGIVYQFALNSEGEFSFKYMGENCTELFGYSASEILANGNLVFELIPEPDADMVNKAIQKSARTMTPYNLKHRVVKRDGEVIWIHAVSTPRVGEHNDIVWDGIGLNITDRIDAEMELQDREATLNSIHRLAPVGMGILDPERRFHWPNQQLAKITGYSIEDLDGMPTRLLYDSDKEYQRVAEEKKNNLKKEGYSSVETTWIRHDGQPIDVILSATLKNPQNPSEGLIGSVQDITNLKMSEKALRESEEKYRNLVNNLQEGIWQIDSKGHTTFVNSPMAEMLGYTQDEMIGEHLFEFMDEDGVKAAAAKLKNRQKGIKEQHEFDFMHKNGTSVYTLVATVPLFDNEKQYTGSLASVMNISERKIAEKTLSDINATLNEAQSVARIGSWSYDSATQVPTWTEEMFHIFGLEPQPKALPYADHRKLIHPDDWDRFDAAVNHAVTDGIGYNLELRITLPSGEIRHVNTRCKAERDHDGKAKRLIGTTQDITDIKQKEKTLLENEQRLKLSSEFGGIGLWELNLVDHSAWRSLKHDQIFGYKTLLPEWTYEIFLDHVVEEDRPMVVQKFDNALDSGGIWNFECQIKRKDGIIRWISVRGKFEIDTEKSPKKMLGIVEDITDRKKAERDSLILKTAIDQAPVGIALADENIQIYYCNPEGLGMRGGEAGNLVEIPKNAFNNWQVYMLNGEAYELDNLPLVRAIRNGEIIREEFIVRHQDGTDHICDAFACPVFENDKTIGGMVIFLDITERKKIEVALKEKSSFLDKVIESSALSTWISDEKGTVIRTNPACLEFFGATEEEVIGKYNLFQDTVLKRSGFIPDIQEVFEKGRSANIVIDYDFSSVDHVKVQNATHKTINSIFTPIKDDIGNVSNVIVQTIDLTDIKRMENELMQARKMESIGDLAGGIAHEFNNILSIIIGNNELIMEELPKWSLARESTEEIRVAGMRARDVVRQLLTFSRQDNATKKIINIGSVIDETMKLIRSSIPTNIEIQKFLSDDICPIFGNATQINQLLINLCNNAVDAMPDTGGKLTVELRNEIIREKQKKYHIRLQPGQYVKLLVSDNGTGMDKEILDKVFDPYFTTKEVGKGTGIGLAVVHGIAQRHGGAIAVDSHSGKGTTFTIFLPIHEGLPEDEGDEQTVLPTGNERVLYVDDEPSIAKLGKRHLESLGYVAESTTDPLQALEMVKKDSERFDLVISDMAMPNMTGNQLIVEVLKVRPDMPTIICTGYSEKFSEKEAVKIGVTSFLMKPLAKTELAQTIRNVLDGAKSDN